MDGTPDEDVHKRLIDALESDPQNASHQFDMAFFLWERGKERKELREKAAAHLFLSVKLNPNNSVAFRLLGHYYSRVSIDLQRAQKCYQRAITIDPDDSESGESLCDLLDRGGKESLEMTICQEAAERSPRAFWAWRRLGYLQATTKKWPDAVQSLQHAIRGYPTCPDLWEALGLAYQRLGMFTAALKSYGRAIELDKTRVYALVESGNVLIMLGSYRKAVDQFRDAVKIAPHNLSACYGLAYGLLGMSRDSVSSGAFACGASLLEEAFLIIKESSCVMGNMSSLWKLLGDIQVAYAKCLPWSQPSGCLETDEASFAASIFSWKEKRHSALITAKQAYQKALHLSPWQANIYADIAISLDRIHSLTEINLMGLNDWQVAEKMSLGGLMLESGNNEFWAVLGCLASHKALQQHALIRGLQLDVSHAASWAYLGKLYREEGQMVMSKQSLDRARSIDPSLALPWAAMSTISYSGDISPGEAFESCLHAVQLFPLAEFQLGLVKLAAASGNLHSSQVLAAAIQAVQRAPNYPESHNLYGLVCEARSDFQSAVSAYRRARCAANAIARKVPSSYRSDITVNLARSLCRARHVLEAAEACDALENEGYLDYRILQIYAVVLWELGRNDEALSIAKRSIATASNLDQKAAAAALGLICKLLYHISGPKIVRSLMLKKNSTLLQNSRNAFLFASINALDSTEQLEEFVLNGILSLVSYEEAPELHSLIAMGKQLSGGSNRDLGISCAIEYVKKALHIHPHSVLLRNQLSSLLLQDKNWKASHSVTKCIDVGMNVHLASKASKPAYENLGSAAVACYACCSRKTSFSTCEDQHTCGIRAIHQLQKWYHQEPWNSNACYLLVLTFYQKAREEKFPRHICNMLKRLIQYSLSSETYVGNHQSYQHKKFLLLLCASEICLQCGDYRGCLANARDALKLPLPNGVLFFAHLQLCRAYASSSDLGSLQLEYEKCLQIGTDYEIGWLLLKLIECRFKIQCDSSAIDTNYEACLSKKGSCWDMWISLLGLVRGQSLLSDQDFLLAEGALAHACTSWKDSCLLLVHGAICMELARRQAGSRFLSLAVHSLSRAQEVNVFPLPIVSALLAQAEASLGAKTKWERDLRLEWYSWPPEIRPAELYFQMHVLSRKSKEASGPESSKLPYKWILCAIHLNPSCSRYWKALQKLKDQV